MGRDYKLIKNRSIDFYYTINYRRSVNDNVNDADHALKEIAAEEIDEVDIIMEDISDEIKDLQVKTPSLPLVAPVLARY